MKMIFNFLTPLNDRAREQLTAAVGYNTVALIPVQLNLNAAIGGQVKAICQQAVKNFGQPDYIILPSHNLAAVFVDRYFYDPMADYYVPLIRLIPQTVAGVVVFGGIEE